MEKHYFDPCKDGFYGVYYPCAENTDKAFPQSMLEIMMPFIGNLFVGLAFKAGRKHPKECKQTLLDIDRRISAAILKW